MSIPGNLLVPFWFGEIKSGGTPFEGQPRLLLVGQMLPAGAAVAGVPLGPIQSEQEADGLFGLGSMMSAMYRIARRNAPFQPIWCLPLAEPAGAAAAGSVSFTTASAVTGAAILNILGRRLAFQVNAADANTAIATAAAAAINAAQLPVIAAVDGTTAYKVNVTARHKGTTSNGLEVALATDEPNVLTATNTAIVALSGGTGTPDLVAPFSACGDDEYDWIAGPYADTASLNAARDFLDDTAGRWSPSQQLYGHYTSVNFGTLSANVTLGNGRNDQHASIMASQVSPTPPWEWAAAIGAVEADHLGDAPELSRPLHGLPLLGVLPPRDRSKYWRIPDRQALYVDGMSAYRVLVDGTVVIDRIVTTYQQTVLGAPDATFRPVNVMAQAMFLLRYLRTAVSNKHGRQALADENPFNVPEQTTPNDIRVTFVHAYNDLCALGVTENRDLFARYVVVQRDPNNADRVNAAVPVDVVNQLNLIATTATIYAQFNTPSGNVF
jgi:phage tail sheath gpL-like